MGSLFLEEYSASLTHVMVLSPEVRVNPAWQSTNTSLPFLTGNTVSVFRFRPIGSSLHVPGRFYCMDLATIIKFLTWRLAYDRKFGGNIIVFCLHSLFLYRGFVKPPLKSSTLKLDVTPKQQTSTLKIYIPTWLHLGLTW